MEYSGGERAVHEAGSFGQRAAIRQRLVRRPACCRVTDPGEHAPLQRSEFAAGTDKFSDVRPVFRTKLLLVEVVLLLPDSVFSFYEVTVSLLVRGEFGGG